MNKFIIAALVCAALAWATPVVKRQALEADFRLPDGADVIVGELSTTFSCDGRIYGYYADVANRCQVFHVCVPVDDGHGDSAVLQYSFFCGNQTVFDQRYLTCTQSDGATGCEESELYYGLNENFGKIDDTE